MNELQFGNRIRQLLNQGIHVPPHIEQELARAREFALSRQRTEKVSALNWADNMLGAGAGEAPAWQAWARLIVPAAVLVVAIAGVYSWQEKQRLAEIVELDALLLADDLPIDAYLDRGFQNWLKKRAAGE